jgi:hypothetical protein
MIVTTRTRSRDWAWTASRVAASPTVRPLESAGTDPAVGVCRATEREGATS